MTNAPVVTQQDIRRIEMRARKMRAEAIRAAFKRAAAATERLFHAPARPAGVRHA